jgi:aspartyl-tRNA(Asn)/glutamyl-tRNA(Gln) amidotransferase subunit A
VTVQDFDACSLAEALAGGSVGAEEVLREYLRRIERLDPQLHVFNEVHADRALGRAREIDAARSRGEALGALAGVPVALKDNLCLAYGRTTCSSRILESFRSPYTATVVAALEQAGAVVVGKTNMDEFAMGSSTETSAGGPTHNPWDPERVAGGSSGGSAAAVSARLSAAALGSDTGGSIRQPAAFCGVVGLKPSYGRVSRHGLVAYGSSLDQIGPLTQSVRDAALVLREIADHDPADSTSVDTDVPDYLSALDEVPGKVRIGVVEGFRNHLPPRAVDVYRQAGAEIVDVELPHSAVSVDSEGTPSSFAVACYSLVAMAEASSNLARYDGVRYGHRGGGTDDIVDLYCRTRSEGFGDEVKRRIMLGAYTLSSGYYDAYYNKALQVRRLIREDFDRAFERCDALLCPTTPGVAFRIGEKTADPLAMYLEDVYTVSVNLAGLPAVSIPCELSAEGLPRAIQIIGRVFDEEGVLRIARIYERESGVGPLVPPSAEGGSANG